MIPKKEFVKEHKPKKVRVKIDKKRSNDIANTVKGERKLKRKTLW